MMKHRKDRIWYNSVTWYNRWMGIEPAKHCILKPINGEEYDHQETSKHGIWYDMISPQKPTMSWCIFWSEKIWSLEDEHTYIIPYERIRFVFVTYQSHVQVHLPPDLWRIIQSSHWPSRRSSHESTQAQKYHGGVINPAITQRESPITIHSNDL
jgi:hypothetical protein